MFILFFFVVCFGFLLGTWFKGRSPYPLPYKFLLVFFVILGGITISLKRPSITGEGGAGDALGQAMVFGISVLIFAFFFAMALGAHMRFMKNWERLYREKKSAQKRAEQTVSSPTESSPKT